MKKNVANHVNKNRGLLQMAEMVVMLTDTALTVNQLAERMGCTTANVYLYAQRLRAEKRIFIESYIARDDGGRPAPLFRAGNRPDAEYVRKTKPRNKVPIDRCAVGIERVRAALDVPRTAEEVGNLAFMTGGRARHYIGLIRAADDCYIKEWRHPGKRGDLAPVYALGKGKDKPKPRQSRADRWKREKADRQAIDLRNAKRRANYAVAKHSAKPNTWLSALM